MLKEGEGETTGVTVETQRLVKVLTHHADTPTLCLTDGQTDGRIDGDSKVGDDRQEDRQQSRRR